MESKQQDKRTNETKQKEVQRYREQTGGYQRRGEWVWVRQVEGMKRYKLPVIKSVTGM